MTIAWEPGVRDPGRVAAVERSGLLGTPPEDAFDRLIELAADLIGVRRGCITLIDAERDVPKSSVGFPDGARLSVPIELTFCRFVVSSGRPLIVDDARLDTRTAGEPAVEHFGVVTWAGFPIEDADGVVLGTFCLMDDHPHEWCAQDLHLLATLAKAASSEIALRRAQMDATAAREEVEKLRSADALKQAWLIGCADELIALGEPAQSVGHALLARLDVNQSGTSGGSGRLDLQHP